MKVNTEYKKTVTLEEIFLGEMFECRPTKNCEGGVDEDGTPVYTPLLRIQAHSNSDVKDGYLFAVDPYNGFTYMIPRYKNVTPLESELTVKK